MRYLRILFLHFESVLEHRLRSLVWFFNSTINPLMLLLFWSAARAGGGSVSQNWSNKNINSYYLLLIVAAAMLVSHSEEDIAYFDIRHGDLVRYLMKPFSYYWLKLIEELPYRVLQGFYGMIAVAAVSFFPGSIIEIDLSPKTIFVGAACAIIAFFISHTYKTCLGFLAFWMTEIRGISQLLEIVTIIFAGYIVPIEMLPAGLRVAAQILPFAYIIYYPVRIFQLGQSNVDIVRIIAGQLSWLAILVVVSQFMWRRGIKSFTAAGQ